MKKLLSICSLLFLGSCGYMSDDELDNYLKDNWGITYEEWQNNSGKSGTNPDKSGTDTEKDPPVKNVITYGAMKDILGNKYKTVIIGNHEWMAENLKAANIDGVTCYANTDEDSNFVENYGCLYTWDDATQVCPSGWRLPTKDEFNKLLTYVTDNRTGSDDFLALIKKSTAWKDYSNQGLDEFGFGALPAGFYSSGYYLNFGDDGSFWSSTEIDSSSAYYLGVNSGHALVYDNGKTFGYSVRCLRDLN